MKRPSVSSKRPHWRWREEISDEKTPTRDRCTLVLSTPAWADNIVLTATVDGIVVDTITSINGNLNVTNASFGPFFNLNTLTINSATFLAPPGILSTNTLDVNQSGTGDHTLVLDIQAQGLTGPSALADLLSEFSVTGLTSGWTGREQTFINGTALSDTGIFTANFVGG